MVTPTNFWKLGLFVVVSFGIMVAALIFIGARALRTDTVECRSYFDESVQGLEVGSPVKFRGVTLGGVSKIDVAPDRRHVEVAYELRSDALSHVGLAGLSRKATKAEIPADMRAQIAAAGITGVKFVQLDYFSPAEHPPEALPFTPPDNYIPSAPSTMKNLEDAVMRTAAQFPEIAKQATDMLASVNNFVRELDQKHIPEQTSAILVDVHEQVKSLDTARLSRRTDETLRQVGTAVAHLDELVTKMDSDRGLLASAQKTTETVGEVARNAKGIGRQMESTLREIRDAADSVRRLADALEQDPDMLLKGRSRRVNAH